MKRSLEEIQYSLRRYLSIRSAYAPAFSPDDRTLAFVTDLTGVPQLWTVNLATDQKGPQQLTALDDRVGFVSYARYHDLIAYGVDSGGDERFQIHLMSGSGDSVLRMTNKPTAIYSWGDWSPDERAVAYSSNERDPAFFDLYIHALTQEGAELVYQHDGNNYPVSWSPDGKRLLFLRMNGPLDYDLYLLALNGGDATRLTPHRGDAVYSSVEFDLSGRFVYCVTDQDREFSGVARVDLVSHELEYVWEFAGDVDELAISRDGKKAALTVNRDGYSDLLISEKMTERPRKARLPKGLFSGLRWSNAGDKIAMVFSSHNENPDVWLYKLQTGALSRVTRSSLSGLNKTGFQKPVSFRYPSFDGLSIPAFLYKPKSGGPFPLLVYLHGGPESQFRPGFSPLIQYFLSLGIGVAVPNFRGSTGYGKRFTHLDDVRKRMDTVKDVREMMRYLGDDVHFDHKRVAAWGGSYGGFMVLACLYANPELWRAGVDIVGIANFVTFLKNTGPWRRKLRIAEYGDPEKDSKFLNEISPVHNAHLITAPLFIIHGTNDPRVPLGEAEQMAVTLEDLGREVHLMKFEDEGHGLVKLKNRIAGYSASVEFLARKLLLS